MAVRVALPPHQTGLYIYQHDHTWYEIGATKEPAGWYPVFACTLCPDLGMGDYLEEA